MHRPRENPVATLGHVSPAAGGEHEFLVDHNVDGRVLMPATSYVVTAWEAAAAAAERPVEEFPASFEDVAIHQAVVATQGQKVTLAVQLAPAGKFYVRPNPRPSKPPPAHDSRPCAPHERMQARLAAAQRGAPGCARRRTRAPASCGAVSAHSSVAHAPRVRILTSRARRQVLHGGDLICEGVIKPAKAAPKAAEAAAAPAAAAPADQAEPAPAEPAGSAPQADAAAAPEPAAEARRPRLPPMHTHSACPRPHMAVTTDVLL